MEVLTCRDDMKLVVVREPSPKTLVMRGATNDADACQTALKERLTDRAEEHLIPWLKRISDEIGLSYSAISIRQQQTRWGSCSSRRLISLNARLLFLPPELVTYVLVYELCHTKHLNHSPRFWRLVESYLPDYRQSDRQLRNGSRWMPGWLTASCGAKAGRLGVREARKPNAELCVYLVPLHPNTTQRRGPLCLDICERANLRAHAEGGSHYSSPFISRVSGYRLVATHLRSIQSLAGRQCARGRLDDGGVVVSMLLCLRTIVLLMLASLPVNAANVTGVIVTKETARSPAVNVAAVYQIQTRNRSGPIDLGSVGGVQDQTEETRREWRSR
jgi:hypothetical protein